MNLNELMSWACATQVDIELGRPIPQCLEDILNFLDFEEIEGSLLTPERLGGFIS